jgi:hypothetical protein
MFSSSPDEESHPHPITASIHYQGIECLICRRMIFQGEKIVLLFRRMPIHVLCVNSPYPPAGSDRV